MYFQVNYRESLGCGQCLYLEGAGSSDEAVRSFASNFGSVSQVVVDGLTEQAMVHYVSVEAGLAALKAIQPLCRSSPSLQVRAAKILITR